VERNPRDLPLSAVRRPKHFEGLRRASHALERGGLSGQRYRVWGNKTGRDNPLDLRV